MTYALAAYTMILLRSGERFLMLKRAESKRFAPGRWTGLGGRVEDAELADLSAAGLRELREETGIQPADVQRFTLRRALIQARPDHPVTALLYFTGDMADTVTPACPEGTLHWLTEAEIAGVDVIENTARVIPLLISDMNRDPEGIEPPVTGAGSFDPNGALRDIVWSG